MIPTLYGQAVAQLRQNDFRDCPVLEREDGTRHVCIMIIESTWTSPPHKWFVFGVVNGIEGGGTTDYILYGFVQGQTRSTSRVGTFSLRNIIEDAHIYTTPEDMLPHCPPSGWKLIP